MSNPNAVQIIFVLDESGSMYHLTDDVIGGFNSLIEEQKKVGGLAEVSLYTFSHVVDQPLNKVSLETVQPLTSADYLPAGMTAMNDAIGTALRRVLNDSPDKAIINIFTDGYENSSKEYTAANVKSLVEQAEAKGYQIVFLAANIDEKVVASSFGIAAGATRGFTADAKGMEFALQASSAAVTNYRTAGGI